MRFSSCKNQNQFSCVCLCCTYFLYASVPASTACKRSCSAANWTQLRSIKPQQPDQIQLRSQPYKVAHDALLYLPGGKSTVDWNICAAPQRFLHYFTLFVCWAVLENEMKWNTYRPGSFLFVCFVLCATPLLVASFFFFVKQRSLLVQIQLDKYNSCPCSWSLRFQVWIIIDPSWKAPIWNFLCSWLALERVWANAAERCSSPQGGDAPFTPMGSLPSSDSEEMIDLYWLWMSGFAQSAFRPQLSMKGAPLSSFFSMGSFPDGH